MEIRGKSALGSAPHFDGTDTWPVDPASLASPPSLASANTQFPAGYLTANTWVGRATGDLVVPLTISASGAARSLPLPIQHAVVTMNLDAAHTSAAQGTIAGVVPVTSLTSGLKQLAGEIDPSLCNGPTIDSILQQLAQAADIMADGTQDPTKVCDGISIGLGFDGHVVQLGDVAAPVPPPPNPCGGAADAGP